MVKCNECDYVGWREIASGCGICALYKNQTNDRVLYRRADEG
jgi:hypothetical protein